MSAGKKTGAKYVIFTTLRGTLFYNIYNILSGFPGYGEMYHNVHTYLQQVSRMVERAPTIHNSGKMPVVIVKI